MINPGDHDSKMLLVSQIVISCRTQSHETFHAEVFMNKLTRLAMPLLYAGHQLTSEQSGNDERWKPSPGKITVAFRLRSVRLLNSLERTP